MLVYIIDKTVTAAFLKDRRFYIFVLEGRPHFSEVFSLC